MELLNVKLVYLMNHVYLGKFKKKKKKSLKQAMLQK